MSPLKTLLSILSLFVVLGLLSIIYPEKGVSIGDFTLRFPALTDIFEKAETQVAQSDSANANTNAVPETATPEDPEAALKEMLAATRHKELTEFSDSLKFYADFFKEGATRFDLPDNNPNWFDRFFQNLEQTEADSTVVHIVHYGDSQLEEDRISSTIREDLQARFGGNGPGLLPPILNTPSLNTSYWNRGNLTRYMRFGTNDDIPAAHGRYGMLSQMVQLSGSATFGIKKRDDKKNQYPHVGSYSTIRVLASKRGNIKLKLTYDSTAVDSVGVNEDGSIKTKIKVSSVTAADPTVDSMNKLSVYTWKLPDTTSSVKINVSGNAEIYGIAADGKYGVAVDNVAMRGSSGTGFARMDEELLAECYKAMNARLIIMEYGGNMVPVMAPTKSKVDWLRNTVTKQIKAIQKANPDADIVFIGPADMEKLINGKWVTYPGLAITIQTLREIAQENGIAYWDMHRVMGGNGAISKWVKQNPALGFTDHVHFTRRGAAYMGQLFSEALKVHYDYFKFRDKHKITDEKLKEIQNYSDSVNTAKIVTVIDDTNIDSTSTSAAAEDQAQTNATPAAEASK